MTVDAFTRFERDGWSRAAKGYHRFVTPVTGRVAEPLLDAADVTAGARVLDVATGPGDLAALAAGRGGAGVVVAAVAEAGATPPADLPAGPPFFAYAGDDALAGLLRGAGLGDVEVQQLAFTHRVASADELWDGIMDGTVRTSALVAGQPPDVRRRIRSAFDRLAAEYALGDGLELPVSVKVASGRR